MKILPPGTTSNTLARIVAFTYLACCVFALLLAGCQKPNHQKNWVGVWIADADDSSYWDFNSNGTWQTKLRDGTHAVQNNGTYSVTKTTFKVTYGYVNTFKLLTGTWERIGNKLVLYIDPPPVEIQSKYLRL